MVGKLAAYVRDGRFHYLHISLKLRNILLHFWQGRHCPLHIADSLKHRSILVADFFEHDTEISNVIITHTTSLARQRRNEKRRLCHSAAGRAAARGSQTSRPPCAHMPRLCKSLADTQPRRSGACEFLLSRPPNGREDESYWWSASIICIAQCPKSWL